MKPLKDKSNVGKWNLNRLLKIAAWVSLLAAYIFGLFLKQEDYFEMAREQVMDKNMEIVETDAETMRVKASQEKVSYKIRFGSAQGYGGELFVGVMYDSAGIIKEVLLLKDRETLSFLNKLKRKGFFQQFQGKAVNEALELNSDLDALSGCTVSSLAYSNAIREASYSAAEKDFNLVVTRPTVKWIAGMDELAMLILIIMGITSLYVKKKWIRYMSLGFALALLGFYLNASLSISHFARLSLGYLPDLKEHMAWWALLVVALAFPFFLKKNLYCYALCPFHAVEIVLIKISGFKLKLSGKFRKAAKPVSSGLLWLSFMLIFLSKNPTLGSYEPFALLFSLDGVGLQWYLLPAALIGALLVPDYYCRYFCPVGRALKLVGQLGRTVTDQITPKSRRNEGK